MKRLLIASLALALAAAELAAGIVQVRNVTRPLGQLENQQSRLVLVVGFVLAIMVIWYWDPVAFISNSIGRISDFFLQWEWFRNLVGAP